MMNETKREILKMRYLREETRFRMNSILLRELAGDDTEILKEIFLGVRYTNQIMERYIKQHGITKEDLNESARSAYDGMEIIDSTGDLMESLIALFPDEDTSKGSD